MLKSVSFPGKTSYILSDDNSAKVIIDGCYPGYGTTLGNALRRVLLSSLPGAAATSIKISGVSHEFSTVPGVLEDVIQIILNMKKIRFKLTDAIEEPVRVTIKEKGDKVVTAGDIKCPSGVEVANKDAVIATITDKKAELEIEIEVMKGLGYVPVEQQERESNEIGVIAIDAVFTPIKRVNFLVENTRVGKRTDYDKVTLDIETDGTIEPVDAFKNSVEILVTQFETIKNIQEDGVAGEDETDSGDQNETATDGPDGDQTLEDGGEAIEQEMPVVTEDPLMIEVATLGFSTRTSNGLSKAGIERISDIVERSEIDLLNIEGMGLKSIKEIKKVIGSYGLTLKA
jgi:DNA-directed RNA polymerase subunit alpha